MSGITLITMLIVLGTVWGGLALTLRLALKNERLKKKKKRSNSTSNET